MKLIIDIPENDYELVLQNDYSTIYKGTHIAEAIINGIQLPEHHGRKFEEIIVGYPSAELCTYSEYRGKPYFSIKYEENGEYIIGFGTYKPEVLSRYLREYFIAPTIIEAKIEGSESE